jgi:energy-coupling factor transporter ATP-binding protein EcfA2
MATIRRVTIHRLRNVKPGCTFELHSGLNVLLGQNGTGKTTLLQWMADFMSGNLESWSREPYHVEVEMEAGTEPNTARIEMTIENDISELAPVQQDWSKLKGVVAARLQQQAHSSVLTTDTIIEVGDERYEIHESPAEFIVQLNGQRLARLGENRVRRGPHTNPILFTMMIASHCIKSVRERLIRGEDHYFSQIMEDLRHYWSIERFDESLNFFHRLVEGREPQTHLGISQSFIDDSLSRLIPDEVIQAAWTKIPNVADDLQMLTFSAEEVKGFLTTAVELFQYRSAALHLTLLEKSTGGADATATYGNLRFTFHRHDGSIIGHDALSYGQKRMLSFLYYLALNPRLIIVDELVNGLHHAWIEACIEEIGDRQALLTSQNPLLLDYLTFDSADEVRQRFILCSSERENGREQLIWRNPTQEEAESFFRAYQAGIQHVGEILVDKGLW